MYVCPILSTIIYKTIISNNNYLAVSKQKLQNLPNNQQFSSVYPVFMYLFFHLSTPGISCIHIESLNIRADYLITQEQSGRYGGVAANVRSGFTNIQRHLILQTTKYIIINILVCSSFLDGSRIFVTGACCICRKIDTVFISK